MSPVPDSPDRAAIAERLAGIRRRTLELVSTVDAETLRRQIVPILSPMIWDLGHIAQFEELWIARTVGGREPIHSDYERLFDALLNPRPTREGLPLPVGRELERYLEQVRRRTLETLGSEIGAEVDPALLEDGFVFEMVAEHEEQHQETLLQAMQLLEDPPYRPACRRAQPPRGEARAGTVEIPAGPFLMGASVDGFAYDNERQRHEVELGAFAIDRHPVTCGAYLEFVESGGYERAGLWSEGGRAWLEETGAAAPANWRPAGDGWRVRFVDRERPLDPAQPVAHVSWFEADAYARFRGARLPTEAEWEKAAIWDPEAEAVRRYPWGDRAPTPGLANVDQLLFEPVAIGSFPGGASYYGVEQMVGDVWEWTASHFTAYPGFVAFPYQEYSAEFFGDDYRVLRGGSWATRPEVARGTFRNWDLPQRRQIFSGLRLAHDR